MRLFLGLLPPPALAREVHDLARPALSDVPVYAAGDLHLTLVFLGEVDPARAASLRAGLEDAFADASGVRLRVGGSDAFEVPGHERALWAGFDLDAEQHAWLADLVARGRALAAASGVVLPAADLERPYVPHLTLARPHSRWRATPAFGALRFDLDWEADAVHLFESVGRDAATPRYPVRASCPLRGL
jgi:2'-5' RNA ligase